MTDLRQALAEINAIRAQVARGTQFRGYGPASTAASGILALAVASLQTYWTKQLGQGTSIYFGIWILTAAICVSLAAIETIARSKRVHSGFATEMIHSAVEQFLPAVIVGLLLTVVILRTAPQAAWMLPGLWELFFSLGVFASCRFLPPCMFVVGVWYLASGLTSLAVGSESKLLSPWMMGVPFGVGQLLVAAVLRYGFKEALEEI